MPRTSGPTANRRNRRHNGVFVIDSCYLPSRADADIALIRRVTDKPVRIS